MRVIEVLGFLLCAKTLDVGFNKSWVLGSNPS